MNISTIDGLILLVRGKRVMLDRDLAALYGVPTKVLNQAVKRHARRFPDDFMFRLSPIETKNWRSQFVTSNPGLVQGHRRAPRAFTEQGVAMLSSVLNSERAVQVNIEIVRAFVRLRRALAVHRDLERRMGKLEKSLGEHDASLDSHARAIRSLFEDIRAMIAEPVKSKRRIGFSTAPL